MKVGDLVTNLNSESKMTGIVVGWKNRGPLGVHPRVLWASPIVTGKHWVLY